MSLPTPTPSDDGATHPPTPPAPSDDGAAHSPTPSAPLGGGAAPRGRDGRARGRPPAEPHTSPPPGPDPTHPTLHLGGATARLRIERTATDDRTRKDVWHLAATWRDGELTARFATAPLARRDIHTFATRLRTGIAAGAPFSVSLADEDRANPLRLHALPAGTRGHAFHLRLTPNGHDTANHLDMEIAPVASETLLAEIDTFLRNLV